MTYSFNKGIEMVGGLIKQGSVKTWQHNEEEIKEYFKIRKDEKEVDIQALRDKINKEANDSAEQYLGNLVTAGIVNPPAKAGGGLIHERTFVTAEQEAHWDFSRLVLKKVNDFIKSDPDCQKLSGMKRQVFDNKKNKEITVFIEPKLHMRQADAVMASYLTAEQLPEKSKPEEQIEQTVPEPESEPTDEQLTNVEEELENA